MILIDELKCESESEDVYEDGLIDFNMLHDLIYRKERKVSTELIKKHFLVQNLKPLLKGLYE